MCHATNYCPKYSMVLCHNLHRGEEVTWIQKRTTQEVRVNNTAIRFAKLQYLCQYIYASGKF